MYMQMLTMYAQIKIFIGKTLQVCREYLHVHVEFTKKLEVLNMDL